MEDELKIKIKKIRTRMKISKKWKMTSKILSLEDDLKKEKEKGRNHKKKWKTNQ
jgi:hypothetical protein